MAGQQPRPRRRPARAGNVSTNSLPSTKGSAPRGRRQTIYLDLIRDTIRKRIIDGIPDFRLDKDGKEHPTRVFSDRLLELAARRLPELRESQRLEVTGTVHGALDVGVTVEHDFQAILETLEAAGVLVRGPAAGAAAAEAAALERKALERGDGGSTQPDGESA